jgi:hypothetical protein
MWPHFFGSHGCRSRYRDDPASFGWRLVHDLHACRCDTRFRGFSYEGKAMMASGILEVQVYTILSIWLHELGHATAAWVEYDRLGSRRLTIRPFVNLDPILSVFLPVVTSLVSGGLVCFGIGRPFLLTRPSATILMAGPAVNLWLVVLGLLGGNPVLWRVNLMLFAVNMLPFSPMDGWGIWMAWRGARLRKQIAQEMSKVREAEINVDLDQMASDIKGLNDRHQARMKERE